LAKDESHGESMTVATAAVHRRRRFPLVWIVPIVTALIGGWLAWDTLSKRGPTITISFESAEGLQAGQSQLKFKDVVMGTVKTIVVAPDLSKVFVTVETVREAKNLLTDKTIFWVVRPGLFAGNITGLDTLLSGSYIGMRPSTEKGELQHTFVGQENPPILESDVPGRTFKLQTKRIGSISLGSPIFFRDLNVGTVLGWDLGDLAQNVTIHAFVRAPFDKYVRDDTTFWNASGLAVKLGADGIELQLESFKALLLGGIAFDTPVDNPANRPASAAHHVFTLYSNLDQARAAGFGIQLQARSDFPGSVAGLAVGAKVTLHGLKIGEVTDVGLVFDPKTDRIVVPVRYRIEPQRIAGIAAATGLPVGTIAADMVKHGLRATLQSPSLISGEKIVALEFVPDAPPAELAMDGGVLVVPTSDAGSFDSITRSANELLSKINRIDFDRIGKDISGITQGLDDILNGPQMKQTLSSLNATMSDVKNVARSLDTNLNPALKRLPQIATQLQEAVTKINGLVVSINSGYGDNSKFLRDIDRMLPQFTDAARSIRALADLLSRHPEALIKGRTNSGTE
jgi:paraquat-inducible protein B